MSRMKVGVQLHPQHVSYDEYAKTVQEVEALGVDSIWNWDHFFPLYGEREGNNNHFEGWTLFCHRHADPKGRNRDAGNLQQLSQSGAADADGEYR